MNTCPSCHGPLRFAGIHAIGTVWERWDYSPSCGIYIVSDGLGNITGVTGESPRKGYFNLEPVR